MDSPIHRQHLLDFKLIRFYNLSSWIGKCLELFQSSWRPTESFDPKAISQLFFFQCITLNALKLYKLIYNADSLWFQIFLVFILENSRTR